VCSIKSARIVKASMDDFWSCHIQPNKLPAAAYRLTARVLDTQPIDLLQWLNDSQYVFDIAWTAVRWSHVTKLSHVCILNLIARSVRKHTITVFWDHSLRAYQEIYDAQCLEAFMRILSFNVVLTMSLGMYCIIKTMKWITVRYTECKNLCTP